METLFADSSVLNEELDKFAQKLESDLSTSTFKSPLKNSLVPLTTDSLPEHQNNLVFIDPAVKDYQRLTTGIAGAEVIVLDKTKDGIGQITDALAGRTNVASVHIVSHATEANLQLGTAQLGSGTLNRYASAIENWKQSLTTDADILLYGCNIAAGEAGKAFLQELSHLTEADIAASEDLTGNAKLGGDWQLEVTTGKIETPLALSSDAIATYQGVLATRIEAESMSRNGYRVESNGSASGGQVISLRGGFFWDISGTASFDFAGDSGNYDIVVGYYDENDGVAELEVAQNGTTFDSWNLDRDLGSPSANTTTRTTRTVATGRSVTVGDRFTLSGTENGGEYARVDYIEFVPTPNPTAPSTIVLGANAYNVNEADGTVTVNVTRSGGTDETVSVDYNTFNDTAVAGSDYTATSGTLTFAPGETSKDVAIPIIDDTIAEGSETFSIVLDNVGGNGTLGAPRTARITVADNDSPGILLTETSGSTQVTEGGDGDSYSLILSSQPSADVVVNVTPDGQLSTDVSTLTFTPGNWNVAQTVTVSGVDDTAQEGNHSGAITHAVTSSDPGYNNFALRNITVTILDDDSGSFVIETFASGLNSPTAFDWSPDGQRMYVAQQDGVVRVVNNGSLLGTPFIDISGEVNNVRDRGLLGLAVHPDFASNPYVYLAYTYDPPEASGNTGLAGPDGAGNRPSRMIRVTADASTNFTTAVPGSAVVILGTNSSWANTSRPDGNSTNDLTIPPSGITADGQNIQDYLATDSESHSIGAVRFGTDGSLFVSNGDGTSYNEVDPRTVRVQDIGNLSGKILRIDPITGDGLADNPFYNGDPDSNQSKVYSYGLRNPFRFTINPSNGQPYIGDVGWRTWEEINTGRGVNFGWPYYEGGNGTSLQTGEYSTLPEAQAFYASGQPVTAPIYARNHADGAVAVIMGDFYTGTTFPDVYRNALFFSDFGDNTVRYLTFDGSGNVASVNTFDTGVSGIVQISSGDDSNLYFADRSSGQISRWRYDPSSVTQTPNQMLDRRDLDEITRPGNNRFNIS